MSVQAEGTILGGACLTVRLPRGVSRTDNEILGALGQRVVSKVESIMVVSSVGNTDLLKGRWIKGGCDGQVQVRERDE